MAIYDSTGLILAALTTAGEAHQARTQAAEQAARQGASTFTSSFDVAAPTPGLWTKFERVWGESDALEFVYTNVRMTFHTFVLGTESSDEEFALLPQLALGLGFFQSSITTNQLAGNPEDTYALPLSATYTQTVPGLPSLRGSAGVGLDLVGPLVGGAGYEADVRVDFLLFHWLSLYAQAEHRSNPADGGDTRIETTAFNFGATAYYF